MAKKFSAKTEFSPKLQELYILITESLSKTGKARIEANNILKTSLKMNAFSIRVQLEWTISFSKTSRLCHWKICTMFVNKVAIFFFGLAPMPLMI